MKKFQYSTNIGNIKTLVEQMVQKTLAKKINDLEQEKVIENTNDKLIINNNYSNVNNNIPRIPKKKNYIIKKSNKTLFRNESDLRFTIQNRAKKKNNKLTKSDISESSKIIKEGSTNITNTNFNTNINTNLNSLTNLNTNNNIISNNNNNYISSNNNIENDLYSINGNSSNVSSNKNINENKKEYIIINDHFINENRDKRINNNEIEVEIIHPALLTKYRDESFNDINGKINNNINNKSKNAKTKKLSLYEREMRNLKRKEVKLDKKRQKLLNKEMKELKPIPSIDSYSKELIDINESYVPIDKRATKIYSLKLSQRMLNEKIKKNKKIEEEEKELSKYKKKAKIFVQDEWDEFIERQYLWRDGVELRKKASAIYRDNMFDKIFFKPKINDRSKSIIKNLEKGNTSYVDKVFTRLFNDFEEHQERQKIRNEELQPSFKPRISKNNSLKNLFCKLKIPCRSGNNSVVNFRNNTNMKKKYSLNTNKIECNKTTVKSEKLFYDLYNNNIQKYMSINKSLTKKQSANKTQVPTQPTNNTNVNYSDINTDLINSKYIILENPLFSSNKTRKKTKKPFHPLNIKRMIYKNCIELEEEIDANKMNKNNYKNKNIVKNNYNYNNINGISEKNNEEVQSAQSQSQSNMGFNISNNNEEEINNITIKDNKSNYNDDSGQNSNEGTNKNLYNVNGNKDMNIYEKLNDLEKAKKFYGQSQNETINSDNSKLSESNLYKLNIRNNTPYIIRQNVILASKDYSNFFHIPDIDNGI